MSVRALVRRPVSYLPAHVQVVGDLLGSEDSLASAFEGADVVVHLAGANEAAAAREPERTLAETILAAHRVGQYSKRAGIRRVVVVSTVHVYGRAMIEGAELTESTAPAPASLYAVARLTSEHILQAVAGSDAETVVCRLTNGVGAPVAPSIDRWTLVANDLCRQAALIGRIELRTHGCQWRDFVALGDVCQVLAAATGRRVSPGTYNLGLGQPMTVRSLAGLVQDAFEVITGCRPLLLAPDPPSQMPRPYRVVVDRLEALGLAPTTTVKSAVEETACFCVENREYL